MSDEWDLIGYVISSQYRVAVLSRLADSPATPSRIAEDTDIAVTHVSRALGGFRDRGLVELLVPEERKKGRVYGITERGREIWNLIQTKDLVD
jgi:DNA-binding transcriptional ArsR family regulator